MSYLADLGLDRVLKEPQDWAFDGDVSERPPLKRHSFCSVHSRRLKAAGSLRKDNSPTGYGEISEGPRLKLS
jgi:hypothetical protein